ncbi:MAG: hypothetical protein ABI386_06905 [Rhodanobacter sp.]
MTSSDDHRSGRRQHESGPSAPVEQRARELWQEAARRIDPATAGRLRAVRRQALQSVHAPARRAARWLIPTGAVAAMALAVMVVWQPLPHAPAPVQGNHAGSAVEADSELPPGAEQADPALYQNLDFYAWLAANDPQPETR